MSARVSTSSAVSSPARVHTIPIEARMRKAALAYPESYEESPWGERVAKVKGKIFLFAGVHQGRLSVTTKIPGSATNGSDQRPCNLRVNGWGAAGCIWRVRSS